MRWLRRLFAVAALALALIALWLIVQWAYEVAYAVALFAVFCAVAIASA